VVGKEENNGLKCFSVWNSNSHYLKDRTECGSVFTRSTNLAPFFQNAEIDIHSLAVVHEMNA
jgi:hypothetical protein